MYVYSEATYIHNNIYNVYCVYSVYIHNYIPRNNIHMYTDIYTQ